jgi:hypothetical protein
MSFIITLLSSHLLSVIENELVSNEPEIVAMIEQELSLLITKLESYLTSKNAPVATIVNPVLTRATTLSNAVINAGAAAIMEVANG